jgi:hypothetical protein
LVKAASARKTTFLALPLLALNLGQQQFFPARGAVDVAGPRLGGEALTRVVPVKPDTRLAHCGTHGLERFAFSGWLAGGSGDG